LQYIKFPKVGREHTYGVVENITRFCWKFHPLFSSERILKIG